MEKRRVTPLVVIMIIFCLLAVGCQKDKESSAPGQDVVQEDEKLQDSYAIQIGEDKINYSEVMVYVLLLKQKYEPSLGTGIWDFQGDGDSSFEEMAKQEVMDQVTELKIINKKALELGIDLDEDEKAEALETATGHFQALSAEEKDRYGITVGTLDQVYRDNLQAAKVFDIITAGINTEVSDEEARQITIGEVLVKTDGSFGEDEKARALKKAKKLLKQAKKADDFMAFAKKNSESSQLEATFGKGDREKELEEAAFALKKGEMSQVVETKEGYHILYCINDFDEDATADKKEDIIVERQIAFFGKSYSQWLKDVPVTVNQKVWDQVAFQQREQ